LFSGISKKVIFFFFFLLISYSHQNQLNLQKLIKISIINIPNSIGQIPLVKKFYQVALKVLMIKIPM